MARLRDRLINAAWSRAERLGPRGRRRAARLWGATAGRLPLSGLRRWSSNVERGTGRTPSRADVRGAADSWLRNLLESITLEHWTPAEIEDAVSISDEDWARLQLAFDGPGAVLALGHIGSWDLCGAWACLRGMPVASVAERLKDARFERFLDARRAIGMRIHSLDDPEAFGRLVDDIGEGRLVCLLADRDLRGNGVPVTWPAPGGGVPITVPPGPALLSRMTGASLMAVASHYEGERLRITISEVIAPRPGRDGLAAMMQDAVDYLAAAVSRNPTDWHVLGRFFPS